MATVLDGVQVVEVADWGFVPSAGTALGDWGAEVVKIEHPRHGDPIRGLITGGMIPGAGRDRGPALDARAALRAAAARLRRLHRRHVHRGRRGRGALPPREDG